MYLSAYGIGFRDFFLVSFDFTFGTSMMMEWEVFAIYMFILNTSDHLWSNIYCVLNVVIVNKYKMKIITLKNYSMTHYCKERSVLSVMVFTALFVTNVSCIKNKAYLLCTYEY